MTNADLAMLEQKIEDLFPAEQTVHAISIKDYLTWASVQGKEFPIQLSMPPIQRGFVWKPKQIQDLWDSLLRGMPIGSILLNQYNVGEKVANLATEKRKVQSSATRGYHLMDGQQRTLSMLLGFMSGAQSGRRLWIDLGEDGKNGCAFQLRVTTESQPFGFTPDGTRLSIHDKRAAREIFDEAHSVKKSSKQLFEEAVRPYKANKNSQFLFELDTLWNEVEKREDVFLAHIKGDYSKFTEADLKRIEKFRQGLVNVKNQWLALIKIPDSHIQTNAELEDPSHDYLTMLFDRISSGGTRLSPSDLLFSMIKQSWPEAHNLVSDIHEEVGSMMQPTDIVMTAYRLASLRAGITDDPQPNARSFHKNLNVLLGSDSAKGELRNLIESDGLTNAFVALKGLLIHKNDHGLPEAIFPYLDVPLLQVLLFWIMKNPGLVQETNRDEIIRFVLFWLVCSDGAKSQFKASKMAIESMMKHDSAVFPAKMLYTALSKLTDEKYKVFCALTPPQASKVLKTNEFNYVGERARRLFNNHHLGERFANKRQLLIWFQREWLLKTCTENADFENFKPLAGGDDDNVPYHFDHLVPQSNWSYFTGQPKLLASVTMKKFTDGDYHRKSLGNSIGNYRLLSAAENRSRGDASLEKNILHGDEKIKIDCASYGQDDVLKAWGKASPEDESLKRTWDDDRVLAFQLAIESRTIALYNKMFEDAGFTVWRDIITDPS